MLNPKINNVANRESWLKTTLEKIPAGLKILDAGAGELQFKKFCSHLDYTSQDFGQYNGTGNNEGLQTNAWDNSRLDIVSDINNIPVTDKSFDVVLCTEVLEHVPEPNMVIKEFSRILKQNGTLIITAPFCSLTHFAPYYFYNGYSKYWYEKILTEHGFKIEEINYNGNFFDYLIQEINRIPTVEQKYTNKKLSKRIIYRLGIKIVLRLLYILSKNNKNSEELLCFGLHVRAKKI